MDKDASLALQRQLVLLAMAAVLTVAEILAELVHHRPLVVHLSLALLVHAVAVLAVALQTHAAGDPVLMRTLIIQIAAVAESFVPPVIAHGVIVAAALAELH